MRRSYFATIIVSLLVLASSCVKDGSLAPDSEQGMRMVFRSVDMPTKATIGGESDYNENTIRRLDVFFYPMMGTGSDAILHRTYNVSQDEGADGVVEEKVYLTEGTLVALSGGVRRCIAYTIANLPADITFNDNDLSGTSLPEMKAIAIEGGFCNYLPSRYPAHGVTFVMDAVSTINITTTSGIVVATGTYPDNGPIELSRVASKISLSVTVEPEITVNTTVVTGGVTTVHEDKWIPILDPLDQNLLVYLNNMNDHGVTGGIQTQITEASDVFKYNARPTVDNGPTTVILPTVTHYETVTGPDGTEQVPVYENVVTDFDHHYEAEPFYTFPMQWEYGSKKEPFVKVELTWGKVRKDNLGHYVTDGEGNYVVETIKKFYYKVFFPMEEFERNTWYKSGVHLGLLGSEVDEASLELKDTYYYVVPWSNGYSGNNGVAELPGSVGSARYLQVIHSTDAQGYVDIYNQDRISIPFVTSHDCEIVNVTASYDNYSGKNKVSTPIPSSTAAAWLSIDGGNIVFNHTLKNDIANTTVDVAAYYVEFDIRHIDNPAFIQHVKLLQYPAMYITYQRSNGVVYVNNRGYSGNSDRVYVYSDSGSSSSYSLGCVAKPSTAATTEGTTVNTNPNLYTVHVSVLDDDVMYIADTRADEASVSDFSAGKLEHYKMSRTDAGFAVSPEFMIASSYGKTTTVTFSNAQKRCAAYQESGYPQGRWRVPTQGEIQFCVLLSRYGKIPTLFNGEYWAANGQYYSSSSDKFSNASSSSETHFIRCVYDTWAWGSEPVTSAMTTPRWSQNL